MHAATLLRSDGSLLECRCYERPQEEEDGGSDDEPEESAEETTEE